MKENLIAEVYRYPGVTPFSSQQRELLMGREKDIDAFYQLLMLKQMVVLYGKSGYGKSSLIQAGIIPKLIESQPNLSAYFSIRLYPKSNDSSGQTPVQTLQSYLANGVIEKPFLAPLLEANTPESILWYWLKNHQYASKNEPIILFFDQFEELFTYDKEIEINPFAELLGTLLYQNMPFHWLEECYEQLLVSDNFSEKELDIAIEYLYKKPTVKLVFSLRSDRLSLLNSLTKFLPNLLQNYYELDAITEEAARIAIFKPALIIDDKYITPEFEYEHQVVDDILQQVKNAHDGKIDTTALQIICRFVEEQKVWQEKQLIITPSVLGDIHNIFKKFYQTTLDKLSPNDKAKASKAIEEKFIQNNQRIPFAGDYLKQEYQLNQEVLALLEKSTLLRKERDTAGRFIYEIGHDTLIDPILEFAKIRENEAKQKRLRNIILISIIGIAILLGSILFVLRLWNKAEVEKQKAEAASQKAQKALNNFFYQQARTFKDNGDNVWRNEDQENALYYYDLADSTLQKISKDDTLGTSLKTELHNLKATLRP